MITPAFRSRTGQRAFEEDVFQHRIMALVARRQYGKTTIGARIALLKMMKVKEHTVIFGSVKLDLGREMVRKEAAQVQHGFAILANKRLQTVDAQTGKPLTALKPDDFAELYEALRLEFRYYHSRAAYSRTKVVALTPEAVGETGDLIVDEFERVKRGREVWEAIKPFISSNPEYRCLFTLTPPADDTHISFEMFAPPIGAELPVNPAGNLYLSGDGIWVRMITAYDAAADGVMLYDDDTGAPITPEESRRRDYDKDAWDRNYGCKFLLGGTSACGFAQLDTAQKRGVGHCQFFSVTSDLEFDTALAWIAKQAGTGPAGIGFDVATTTEGTSNPSSLAVVERSGVEYIVRAVLNWKTWDPAVAEERIERAVRVIAARKEGGPARRLCVDATNERYWAQGLRRKLSALLPVELVVASETIERPGEPEPMTMKQYLGGQLVGELDDNHLWLPPERYFREDWRLVKKEKGQFVCKPDVDGKHGDTFDASKLGLRALNSGNGGLTDADVRALRILPDEPQFYEPSTTGELFW
ncbi:MAG: hypothetical protein ABSA97_03860 [Verrucomicrobiia bacterium]